MGTETRSVSEGRLFKEAISLYLHHQGAILMFLVVILVAKYNVFAQNQQW